MSSTANGNTNKCVLLTYLVIRRKQFQHPNLVITHSKIQRVNPAPLGTCVESVTHAMRVKSLLQRATSLPPWFSAELS